MEPRHRAGSARLARNVKDLRIGDIENLHRLISIRFGDFDPSIYRSEAFRKPPERTGEGDGEDRNHGS